MLIPEPRQQGFLIKRYKRFLADILLPDNSVVTAYCPNTGSMKGCSTSGSEVVISRSLNEQRRHPWTLEMVRENNSWAGVNTGLTNRLIREALENGIIDDFGRIETIQSEVKVSDQTRLDFLIHAQGKKWYIEVKNCSLAENNIAMFPDAVTKRGTKHLYELDRLRAEGAGAAVIFCVQRADAAGFMPAGMIDPEYAQTLLRVHENGVKVLAYQANVKPEQVTVARKIPVSFCSQGS